MGTLRFAHPTLLAGAEEGASSIFTYDEEE
jgi:hypothetical protein